MRKEFVSPPSREELVRVLHEVLPNYPSITKAWLYGSRVRGDNRPDSDWDVAVFTECANPDDARIYWFRIIEEINCTMDERCLWKIHVDHYNPPQTQTVCEGVEKDGMQIYPPCE